jgi:hypothetical protein
MGELQKTLDFVCKRIAKRDIGLLHKARYGRIAKSAMRRFAKSATWANNPKNQYRRIVKSAIFGCASCKKRDIGSLHKARHGRIAKSAIRRITKSATWVICKKRNMGEQTQKKQNIGEL